VDLVLVQEHGAAAVVGIDVEQQLVDVAADRARKHHLDDRVTYRKVEPGPLPFAAASFDIVFSKDAIIHVQDKQAVYGEAVSRFSSWRSTSRQRLAPGSGGGADAAGGAVRRGVGP